jgi:hypothetical protein
VELRIFTCRVDGCNGPPSGVCINDLPFDECPDVIPFLGDEEEEGADAAGGRSPLEMVPTPGGQSLDAAACDALLRERGGTIVGIVAGPDVGKTTLIGTMYELIHRGRMPDFGFAGSETLRGYEERTFLARMASNRVKPDTPRTKVKELNFTHLRLATKDGIRDVYFSDRSGEHFDIALGKPTEFATFVELERAETILLMVDLEQLMLSPQTVMSSIRRLFMAMEQNSLLIGKPLTLVGTKADLLASTKDRDEAVGRLEVLKEDLRKRSTGGANLRVSIVASRAPKGTSKVGEGFDKLLANILAPPEPPPFRLGRAAPRQPSELDALMDVLRRKPR